MTPLASRLAWIVATAGLVVGLLALDALRGGPVSPLTRCNLALSRSTEAPADVLVLGSSRTGTAIDPATMQAMLGAEPDLGQPTVERMALGRSPLRANLALLENYLAGRGEPEVIVLELSFLTERTVDRIDDLGSGLAAEAFLFRRDVNLMRYRQILAMPAVAMPRTEPETAVNRWRYALRGAVLRSGALLYQFGREPSARFTLDGCDVETWTREPTWPPDFAFSWGEIADIGRPAGHIERLRAELAGGGTIRTARHPETGPPTDRRYRYHLDQPYRAGELILLDRAVALAADRGIPVVLLPLPVSGSRPDPDELATLEARFAGTAQVYDLYGAAGVDLSTSWYDDAHLEVRTAGQLTTALLAQHLADGALAPRSTPDAVRSSG
jgi:hypothetical protein